MWHWGRKWHPRRVHNAAPQILFFGRIWKYKGLEYLIRAQPMITAAFPEARIVIAGAGEDFEPYRRQMAHPDRFIIRNHFIEPAERDELFRQASIVVLPYIEATQSGVVPLAYACAKPVIATRTGALSEAVEDGRTGLLVPPADSAALARAVIELLGDPARRQVMGRPGGETRRRMLRRPVARKRSKCIAWSAKIDAMQTATTRATSRPEEPRYCIAPGECPESSCN